MSPIQIRALTDDQDCLVEADEPLAGLQLRSGGEIPGTIATPGLLELVRKSRLYGLRIARPFRAQDGAEQVTGWAEVLPLADGTGCQLSISNWQALPFRSGDLSYPSDQKARIARQLSELSAQLDRRQGIVSVEGTATDLDDVITRMAAAVGRHWTQFVTLEGNALQQPMHWRLLDGARVTAGRSARHWKVHLVPNGVSDGEPSGFELYLVPDEPLDDMRVAGQVQVEQVLNTAIGREIAPVLRQPIARIIANAETIRTQLAGPLATEYSNYAADISSAGEHLLALIDDLTDLEVVEDEEFTTAPDQIDLSDLARRAAGILGMRARERGIGIDAPKKGEIVPAIGEFRRVLQILLNVLGNAIRYSPEGSTVWLRVETEGEIARIVIADQGEGLGAEQQARVFEKFERLGRSGDGGTGLGLYISRRLARAMDGELKVESAPGQGARFILDLPADLSERR